MKHFPQCCRLTHSEAQHLVVFSVHGLSLLCARGIIFSIKSDSTQLKDDIPLCLKHNNQTCTLTERRFSYTITAAKINKTGKLLKGKGFANVPI